MARRRELSDVQWERLAPLMPRVSGRSRPWRNHRQVVEGIIFRYRTGTPWRDLPERFGPWQTVWKRHRRFSVDGTWDQILARLLADADAAGLIDWVVSVDSTIVRAHQHATRLARVTGGSIESQESPCRTGRSRCRPLPRRLVHEDPPRRRWTAASPRDPRRSGPGRRRTHVPAPAWRGTGTATRSWSATYPAGGSVGGSGVLVTGDPR